MDARMLPAARAAVDAVVAAPDTVVALVSGRSLSDLRLIAEHLDDSPMLLGGIARRRVLDPRRGRRRPRREPGRCRAARSAARSTPRRRPSTSTASGSSRRRSGSACTRAAPSPRRPPRRNRAVDAIVQDEAPHWRRRTGHNIVEYAFRHEGKDSAIAELRVRTRRLGRAVRRRRRDRRGRAAQPRARTTSACRVGDGPTAATICVPDIAALAALPDAAGAPSGPRARE